MATVFTDLSSIIVIATLIAVAMRLLRQPLIVGHIITGLLIGSTFLGNNHATETMELLGSFGVALLLFLVGLGLNPKVVKEVGKVSILTGLGQVIFTTAAGLGVAKLLGYEFVPSLYIAVALTFSSTIIILKLLTDKREHNKLYGKISIGFLLVQDLVATIALVIASASGKGSLTYEDILILMIKGFILLVTVFLFAHIVIRPLTNLLSRSQELLFLFAIAWGFGIATVYFKLGFSLEVGALIGGIALSTMGYAQEISSRLRPLRDFFIVVFFIALGAKMDLGSVGANIGQIIGFSSLVLIGNPLIVMIIIGALGYTKKTGFKAGLAVAQVSEFSFIFVLLGLKNGHISQDVVSLVTLVGIITIAASSYMITYADSLYKVLERYLSIFERKKVNAERDTVNKYESILFGYRRGGSEFVKVFKTLTKNYLVVDYDPEAIEELERKDIPYMYGDVTDPELLDELDLRKTKLVVSHINDHDTNRFVVEYLSQISPEAVVICHADSAHQAAELYGLGASYVMLPHYIGSEKISSFIKHSGYKKSEYKKFRQKHLAELQKAYESEEDIKS